MMKIRARTLAIALSAVGCAAPPPGSSTPLDDGNWRIEPSVQISRRLVSLEPRLIRWQIYMDARGDLDGFSLPQIKDALTVRAQGIECADWRHIHRSHEMGIPGVTDGWTYVDCRLPPAGSVYSVAPLLAQIEAAAGLGFACQRASVEQASCTQSVTGRAVESTLDGLAHPRPPYMAIEFKVEFDILLSGSELPVVTCRSWERSTPPDAFVILSDGGDVRVTTTDSPNSRWRDPVQDCAYQGAL